MREKRDDELRGTEEKTQNMTEKKTRKLEREPSFLARQGPLFSHILSYFVSLRATLALCYTHPSLTWHRWIRSRSRRSLCLSAGVDRCIWTQAAAAWLRAYSGLTWPLGPPTLASWHLSWEREIEEVESVSHPFRLWVFISLHVVPFVIVRCWLPVYSSSQSSLIAHSLH